MLADTVIANGPPNQTDGPIRIVLICHEAERKAKN
jgi:hypothetical protein